MNKYKLIGTHILSFLMGAIAWGLIAPMHTNGKLQEIDASHGKRDSLRSVRVDTVTVIKKELSRNSDSLKRLYSDNDRYLDSLLMEMGKIDTADYLERKYDLQWDTLE